MTPVAAEETLNLGKKGRGGEEAGEAGKEVEAKREMRDELEPGGRRDFVSSSRLRFCIYYILAFLCSLTIVTLGYMAVRNSARLP